MDIHFIPRSQYRGAVLWSTIPIAQLFLAQNESSSNLFSALSAEYKSTLEIHKNLIIRQELQQNFTTTCQKFVLQFLLEEVVHIFLKVALADGEPGIFCFSFIFFHKQHIRHLGYCAHILGLRVSLSELLKGTQTLAVYFCKGRSAS